jgi:hypothetical protein
MSRILGWVATIGLTVGVVSLGLSLALGGRDLLSQFNRHSLFGSPSCEEAKAAPGTTTERHLSRPEGDAIDIALPAIVHFRGGDDGDIVVRAAPNLAANVEIDGHRLRLRCGDSANRDVEIELPGRYRRVAILGSGQVTMDNLSQRRLELHIAGSGSVNAKGMVDRLHLVLAGSGNAQMQDLTVKELRINIAGSGNVDASAINEADIRIAGSGDVRLHGKPVKIKSRISGSGRISQVDSTENSK